MISKSKWQKYIQKLAAIDQRAAEQMRAWIEANGLQDDDALIDYAYALATKYGEASGELACEMYDMMAQAQGAMVPAAVPAETATMQEVAKGAMWGKYHSPSQIPSILGRQVRQAGADTMIQNAVRDHAEWAWIPSGDTCAFCITLASRGWQDASRSVLKGNHAEHIHANCDCTFAISFNSKGRRMYDSIYDPERYKDMYDNAEGNTPAEKINSLRRIRYQQNKTYINAQKRDAYHAGHADEHSNKKINGIASNDNGGYNNSPQDDLLEEMYKKGVKDGWISPLCGLENYKELYKQLQNEVVGKVTANGIEIKEISEHFMQRLIGTQIDPSRIHDGVLTITGTNPQGFRSNARSGTSIEDVKQTLFYGVIRKELINEFGEKSIALLGNRAVVTINPDTGVLIQCNPVTSE